MSLYCHGKKLVKREAGQLKSGWLEFGEGHHADVAAMAAEVGAVDGGLLADQRGGTCRAGSASWFLREA
jgi:hypothetical protein